MDALKIIELKASNFKRLSAVEIKPKGDTVVVSGPNGAGKSSVLDAITAALCGKKASPPMPIRQGETEAEIEIDLGQFVVKRKFTDKGSYLTITAGDMKAGKPQELLDKIVGQIAFDPMAFIRMSPADQRKTLMDLVGLSLDDLDEMREKAREAKNAAAADKRRYENQLASLEPVPDDTPDEEVSAAEIVEELTKAKEHNLGRKELIGKVVAARNVRTAAEEQVAEAKEAIEALEEELRKAKEDMALKQTGLDWAIKAEQAAVKAHDEFVEIDTEPLIRRLDAVDETNRKVRAKKARLDIQAKIAAAEKIRKLSAQRMEDWEAKKVERLKEVKWPVPGLAVTDAGVTFQGIPLEQVNTSAQIRVGVAVAMAMNPKLRVLRMSGNDLDETTLRAISDQAGQAGYQLWIERIEDPTKMGIVIEDGTIKHG